MGRMCEVTGCTNTSRNKSMYGFPNPSKRNYREPRTYDLALRRREAWITAINRSTFILSQEKSRICSIHFSTGKPARLEDKNHVDWIPTLFMNGDTDDDQISKTRARKRKPAYLYSTNDVDWVPSINLGSLGQDYQLLSLPTENPPTSDSEPPPKQSKTESTNSNQGKEKPATPVVEEPVKRKVIYSRPVQPVNGIWPRLTATIITPESINGPCNSLLLNNLGVQNKSDEIVESVSAEGKTEITVKKEKDTSTADADDYVPDCDLSAAYCFTSKLKEEKATQVTAEEIRRAFQLTASTQTLWR